MTVKSIVEDGYYIAIAPDGTELGRRSKWAKCLEDIYAHYDGVAAEYRIRQPEVKVTLGAAKVSDGIIVPTPDGDVDTRYPDGDDGGSAAPTTPVLGQPVVVSSTEINVPLLTAATGGTAPITYTLEISSTRDVAGFSVQSADAQFGEQGAQVTGLTAQTQYWFRVKAVDVESRESGYSEVATAITVETETPTPDVPAQVTGLAIGTIGETTLENITWNAAEGATSYRVLCGLGDGSGGAVSGSVFVDTTTTELSYPVISGLDNEQEYYVRVCPLNAGGQGTCSSRVFATTLAVPEAPEEPVSSDIIFGPWTHESEPLGVAQPIANIWGNQNNDPNDPAGGTTWEITADNPMTTGGGKYYRSTLNHDIEGHKRTERKLDFSPIGDAAADAGIISLGGDDWRAKQKVWYGYLIRGERADSGPFGFYQQYHSPSTVGNSSSPVFGIRGISSGIRVYRKGRANNAPQATYTNNYSSVFLTTNEFMDHTHAIIYELFWYSIDHADAVMRVYVDDNPTPVYQYDGKRNVTYGYTEMGSEQWQPQWRHGLYATSSTYQGYLIQSYDRITVMGEGGSRLGMLDALDFDNI